MSSAGQIIRQRRSLLACDGTTSIPAGRFYQVLSRTMPVPWDAIRSEEHTSELQSHKAISYAVFC